MTNLDGKFCPEGTFLQFHSEFRKFRDETREDCKVAEVIMRKNGVDVHMPISQTYRRLNGGVVVIVEG